MDKLAAKETDWAALVVMELLVVGRLFLPSSLNVMYVLTAPGLLPLKPVYRRCTFWF